MGWLLIALLAAAGAMMLLERRGLKTTLALGMKGDLKRETRWIAQYGQGACTIAAAALVWRLDRVQPSAPLWLLGCVFGVSLIAVVIKRLVSRVRPGRDGAGTFLGPHWKHANWRESFPSSHSAAAMALSVFLAGLYPQAREVFWTLAILCATLRYLMDAHWPSDILAGIALGCAGGQLAVTLAHWA